MQQETNQWNWLKSFICEHILSRLKPDNNVEISRNDATSRQLLSTFLSYSLSNQANFTDTVPPNVIDTLREIESNHQQPRDGPLLPEPSEENVPDPTHTTHTYNRNVIWTFEDIRMLIGTDMAIFGGTTRPCISLRLRGLKFCYIFMKFYHIPAFLVINRHVSAHQRFNWNRLLVGQSHV